MRLWGARLLTLAALMACALASAWIGARDSGLTRISFSQPLAYAGIGDAKFHLGVIKGIIDHGWWTTNPSLGYPFGQHMYDLPQGGDALNLLVVRLLAGFSSNPAWIMNVFLLLTFPACAISCFLVLRWLGRTRVTSVMGGILFALLPYHFYRSGQLWLTAYYAIPLAAYLFVTTAFDPGEQGRFWTRGRMLKTVVIAIIVGSGGIYYAVFAIVLLTAGALVDMVRSRRPAGARPLMAAAAIALVLAVNLSPALVYRAEHGSNSQVTRSVSAIRDYGLDMAGLLLPVTEHRAAFSDLNKNYFGQQVPGYCEQCGETLGTVGDVGFLWLLLVALAGVVGLSGRLAVGRVERRAALGVVLTLLIATIGGFSGLIALLVTTEIRAWNRMSLLIAAFSLLAVAGLVDRGLQRVSSRKGWVGVGASLVALLTVFGVWDETSGYYTPSPYQRLLNAREWASDAAFTRRIQRVLPAGSAVFQLPQVPFPEGWSQPAYDHTGQGMFGFDYQLLRGYIHSTTLRWSYGAMQGRPNDWASQLVAKPVGLVADAAAAVGFSGLWVDAGGYGFKDAPHLAADLSKVTRVKPIYSALGDLAFFDLRPLVRRLTATTPPGLLASLRRDTLHPLSTTCTSHGFVLSNPSTFARRAVLTYTLTYPSSLKWPVRIYDKQRTTTLAVDDTGRQIRTAITLPPGSETMRFDITGQPVEPATMTWGPEIGAPDLTDARVARLAAHMEGQSEPGYLPPACAQMVREVIQPRPLFRYPPKGPGSLAPPPLGQPR